MTPVQIRDAIASTLATWTTTDIAWFNRDFDATGVDKFIRPTVRMGLSYEGEIGESGIGFRTGVLFIDIFTRKNQGNRTALGYASTLENLFRRKDIGGVLFEEPSTTDVGPEVNTKFYHVQVQIPFETFLGE